MAHPRAGKGNTFVAHPSGALNSIFPDPTTECYTLNFSTTEILNFLRSLSLLQDTDWRYFGHKEQSDFLHALAESSSQQFTIAQAGASARGRVIHSLRLGSGPRRVLIWARQHGNEPDCTAGLCAALKFLLDAAAPSPAAEILGKLDMLILPMINPDGVEKFTRVNAQQIDVNRDAIAQATPEGQALKTAHEVFQPEFCFNLHDMSARKSAGDRKRVALAFQAGPFEPRDIDNEVRLKAKTVVGKMVEAVRTCAGECFARYTADYMHRAFGDSMMRWGVSSVLIEAGGWPEKDGGDQFVRALFALSLIRGLDAVAAEEDSPHDADTYETIPFDSGGKFSDLIITGAELNAGLGLPNIRADIAIDRDKRSRIIRIGDLEDDLAETRKDAAGLTILPGLVAAAPSFDPSAVDDWGLAFLKGGVTTAAVGAGPFESSRARSEWLRERMTTAAPLNLLVFERVPALRDIHWRHGMSEFAGLLVQDLTISPEVLLDFCQLFHPARHSAIKGEDGGKMLSADLFFMPGLSPAETRVYLMLSEYEGESATQPVRPAQLRALADEFLRMPSQIFLGRDPGGPEFRWLPAMIGLNGIARARENFADYLSETFKGSGGSGADAVIGALNLSTVSAAAAFGLECAGKLKLTNPADLILARLDENTAQVKEVYLDGRPAGQIANQGQWLLSGGKKAR